MNDFESAATASLWRRLAAALYDLFPLLALWFATGAAALAFSHGALDYHAISYRLSLLGVSAAYFALSWRYGGQTLGGRAWRLRVVGADGGQIGLGRALLRFGIGIVSLLTGGLGFAWMLIDRDHRTWHDFAAGTRVVRVN